MSTKFFYYKTLKIIFKPLKMVYFWDDDDLIISVIEEVN